MTFIVFNNHFQLNVPLIRYIFIAQIIFSSFIIIVITEQLSFSSSPFQQSYYQRFDRSQQEIQKNFQFRQQFPTYLRQDLKKINSKLANNYGAKFINIPKTNLNDTIGALVTIQLQEYNNPSLALPNGYTCTCPSGMQCPYLQDGSITCFFSFTIIISAANQSAQIIESPFVMVPKSPINSGIWTNDNIVNMTVKPHTIDIIVHHLGVVINQETGSLEYFNHLTPIDTFAILLDNYQSTPYGTTPPNIIQPTIIGQILGTTLKLTYYIQCINNKYGPNCDLKCTPSSSDNMHAACISIITGMYYSCKYARDSIKVLDCKLCPYGLTTNQTDCNMSNISSIISQNNTSSAFRIWTIVLGCLLGIALIFIILLVIIFAMVQRRNKTSAVNRRHVRPNKTLLPWQNEEWQRSKIKATSRDSGVASRIPTSEEPIEDEYIRNNIVSTGRREAHV